MTAYLKRKCLFDVSIGALREPESYEEKIDQINNCDRDYGIMCLGIAPNIHHLIYSTEYLIELWNNLDKYFGVQEVEEEAWSEPNMSLCALSQDVFASKFSDEVIYDENISHTVHVAATLFDLNASFLNEEANIKEPYFSMSLEGDFSACDTNDGK